MTPRLVLPFLLLAFLGQAQASHLADNLRDLKQEDLCQPSVQAVLNDEEDDDFDNLLFGALQRYAGAQHLKWGQEGSCIADQVLTLQAYEDSGGGFTYMARFSVELKGDTVVTQGRRRVRVAAPQVWSTSSYGYYADDLQDIAAREVRDMYERFGQEWAGAHQK